MRAGTNTNKKALSKGIIDSKSCSLSIWRNYEGTCRSFTFLLKLWDKKQAKNLGLEMSFSKTENEVKYYVYFFFFSFFKGFVALDGSRIPITAPTAGKMDFSNGKGWDSILLQALVNDQWQYVSFVSRRSCVCLWVYSKFKFRDTTVKMPGGCHDASAFN